MTEHVPDQGLIFSDYSLTLAGETAPLVTLNRTIQPGRCLAIMGASGRGKSTLLLAIAGFGPAWAKQSGRILIGKTPIDGLAAEQRKLGLMLQDDLLFPHLTVGDNLLFGLSPAIRGRAERRSIVEAALSQAGLAGLFDRAPDSLSGGQRARASLLRTVLAAPRALLLDEPFSKLDMTARRSIRSFVFETARQQNLPVLLVTHDERDAEAAGADIVTLPDRTE